MRPHDAAGGDAAFCNVVDFLWQCRHSLIRPLQREHSYSMAAFSIAARLGTGFRTGRMAAAALAASAASGVAPLGVACQQCGVRTLSLAPTGFSSSSVPAVCDTLRLASPWTGRSADSSAGSTGVTSAMILKQQQQQIRLLSHQKLPPMATGRRPAGGATATSGSVGGQPAVPAGGESAATEIGAESNVASSVLAGEKHKQLVEAVFGLYGMMGGAAATAAGDDSSSSSDNSIAQLEATVSMLYAEDATFEDGLMCLKGRSEILKRYVLAAELCAEAVRVTYDPPVVLGATTVAPGPLEHLGQGLMKTNIQVRWWQS